MMNSGEPIETGGESEAPKKPVVEMNTFAQFNIDSSNPVCYPCICRFNLSRLAFKSEMPSSSVYVLVKLETSKRTLRSSELTMVKCAPPDDGEQMEQASSVDLNMNYSITYPFFPNKETNILYFYIQQRKKYKNRTILGYKTIAYASVDLAALVQSKQSSRELPLLARSSRRSRHHSHQQHRTSTLTDDVGGEAEKKPVVGFLSIKSLVNQSLEANSGELLPVSTEHNSLNNFISKNRQLKMLRKELKLLKSKTQLGAGSSSGSSKKKERSKSEKFSDQNTTETETNEIEQQTPQQFQIVQAKAKKPKFKLSLNRRSHAGFTFSDSDEQDPGAQASSSSQAQTAQQPLSASHGKKFSTINAIRKSIINSGNNFASNSNAHKNARKLTGRLISFIRKLRNESDENPDGEIEYDENENELFNYEEVYNLCKKENAALQHGCSASGAELDTEEDVNAEAGHQPGSGLNDESEYEAGEEEVFDSPGNQLDGHHSHMNLLKDQINNIILNDYSNYNDEDFDEDDLNYDLDNIEQISDGFSNIEDVTDHQDVYSIISTPKPKLLPFFTKSQQELNYKFILEEYQASKDQLGKNRSSCETISGPLKSFQASPRLSDFKSPAQVSLTTTSDLSNDHKLDRVLRNLTEKRPVAENEYLFLLIDESDPLCHVLGQRVKHLDNLSYHDITAAGSSDSLSEFKLAFYRVLAWLLKNETILINQAESFYFKVLLIGNDQHVNRYLQAFVDLFKQDTEFIYLKYFKHYFVPSNLVSLNSTVKLASVISLLTSDRTKGPKTAANAYQALFGDKYWLELIRKKRIASHSAHESDLDIVYNEIWSRISRYICTTLPNNKTNLPSSEFKNFGRELKLHIGQVAAVYYGQKFAKLQLPFLVDVKIGALREFSSSHFSNFDLIDCLTGETSSLALEGLPSIFQFDSVKRPQQRTPLADASSQVSAKPSLAFKMSHLSPKDKNRFNSLSNMSLQIDYSFYESVNLSAAKLINSMSVHSMSTVLASTSHPASSSLEPALSSSVTVSDFGDLDWQNSSIKSNVKKASYKYIQIYRTNLLFSKEVQNHVIKSAGGSVSNHLSSSQMLNSLSMVHVTKEKKQKIMRLGKKTKDDDQRIEFVDGLVKIVCKASSQSNSSHTNANPPETNNRVQSPIKISVDGIEYNSIKYLQVSAQWQTNTEPNDLNANFNQQSASKQLKYISFVVL